MSFGVQRIHIRGVRKSTRTKVKAPPKNLTSTMLTGTDAPAGSSRSLEKFSWKRPTANDNSSISANPKRSKKTAQLPHEPPADGPIDKTAASTSSGARLTQASHEPQQLRRESPLIAVNAERAEKAKSSGKAKDLQPPAPGANWDWKGSESRRFRVPVGVTITHKEHFKDKARTDPRLKREPPACALCQDKGVPCTYGNGKDRLGRPRSMLTSACDLCRMFGASCKPAEAAAAEKEYRKTQAYEDRKTLDNLLKMLGQKDTVDKLLANVEQSKALPTKNNFENLH